jgi:hypothetical protein
VSKPNCEYSLLLGEEEEEEEEEIDDDPAAETAEHGRATAEEDALVLQLS